MERHVSKTEIVLRWLLVMSLLFWSTFTFDSEGWFLFTSVTGGFYSYFVLLLLREQISRERAVKKLIEEAEADGDIKKHS